MKVEIETFCDILILAVYRTRALHTAPSTQPPAELYPRRPGDPHIGVLPPWVRFLAPLTRSSSHPTNKVIYSRKMQVIHSTCKIRNQNKSVTKDKTITEYKKCLVILSYLK